jgi:aminopeptidase N
MFGGMTYQKGACVLHALRGLLGDKAWWSGLRGYVADHKFRVVDTDDFRKSMEAASGKDLKWFFDQWLHKAGHPELKVRWHYEDADKTVRVKIEQTQTVDARVPLFRLPTSLEITEDVKKTRVVPIVIDAVLHEFVILKAAKPRMVQIDPEGWLIKELNFEKSRDEHLFQLEHAGSVIGRLAAARALAQTAKDKPEVLEALSAAWKREKALAAQRAAEAIALLLEEPGPKARELAVLYSRYGQPRAMRMAAVNAFGRLAKDDTVMQDLLITMIADPERSVRFRTWFTVRELKLKKASPALTARLDQEATGFSGFGVRILKDTLEALQDPAPQAAAAEADAKTIEDLK